MLVGIERMGNALPINLGTYTSKVAVTTQVVEFIGVKRATNDICEVLIVRVTGAPQYELGYPIRRHLGKSSIILSIGCLHLIDQSPEAWRADDECRQCFTKVGNDNSIWPHRDDEFWPHPAVVIRS